MVLIKDEKSDLTDELSLRSLSNSGEGLDNPRWSLLQLWLKKDPKGESVNFLYGQKRLSFTLVLVNQRTPLLVLNLFNQLVSVIKL